ncbi:DUF2199 domain-containing protein [Phytohabitans kaempferiae]|uniref:DUF2199 domain-containing protein n=1 Tax=Phytohabitans kaempferiae TaxID=1620943 RepID=A0ABV6MH52_9ACTN
MSKEQGYVCRCCGEHHAELPLAYGMEAPAYWSDELAADPLSALEQELCTIKSESFFIRGLIEIPVVDTGETFVWNVWTSLSKDNFARTVERWDDPARESQPPYFGWLSSELPAYAEPTLNLKTNLHTRPVGHRPLIELEPTGHPLAVEQREGITRARVREIAELLLHGRAGQPDCPLSRRPG